MTPGRRLEGIGGFARGKLTIRGYAEFLIWRQIGALFSSVAAMAQSSPAIAILGAGIFAKEGL